MRMQRRLRSRGNVLEEGEENEGSQDDNQIMPSPFLVSCLEALHKLDPSFLPGNLRNIVDQTIQRRQEDHGMDEYQGDSDLEDWSRPHWDTDICNSYIF